MWRPGSGPISEIKRQELALAASEDRFRTPAAALPAMIFVADAQGSNAYTNLQFQTYTGLGEVKLPGIGWLDAIHPDDRERAAAVWAQSSRAGEPYAAEYRFRRADGAWRSFYCRGQPMRDPSKSIVQWVGTCTEIQQMIETRDELAALAVELEPLIRQATPGTSVSLDLGQNLPAVMIDPLLLETSLW